MEDGEDGGDGHLAVEEGQVFLGKGDHDQYQGITTTFVVVDSRG